MGSLAEIRCGARIFTLAYMCLTQVRRRLGGRRRVGRGNQVCRGNWFGWSRSWKLDRLAPKIGHQIPQTIAGPKHERNDSHRSI